MLSFAEIASRIEVSLSKLAIKLHYDTRTDS